MDLSTRSLLVAATFLVAARYLPAAEPTTDALDVVKANLANDKAILIDVREKTEWDEGHLEQADLMPLSRLQLGIDPQDLVKKLRKDKIIYCHCRAGRRSLVAADILSQLGYQVRPLQQGYEDLLKAGFSKAEKPAESKPQK